MRELKVLKPFPYGGKQRSRGERIKAANRHAAILVAAGKAKEVKHKEHGEYENGAMKPERPGVGRRATLRLPQEPQRNEPRNRQRGYSRSDMVTTSEHQ
jgi:hypothetical protein